MIKMIANMIPIFFILGFLIFAVLFLLSPFSSAHKLPKNVQSGIRRNVILFMCVRTLYAISYMALSVLLCYFACGVLLGDHIHIPDISWPVALILVIGFFFIPLSSLVFAYDFIKDTDFKVHFVADDIEKYESCGVICLYRNT